MVCVDLRHHEVDNFVCDIGIFFSEDLGEFVFGDQAVFIQIKIIKGLHHQIEVLFGARCITEKLTPYGGRNKFSIVDLAVFALVNLLDELHDYLLVDGLVRHSKRRWIFLKVFLKLIRRDLAIFVFVNFNEKFPKMNDVLFVHVLCHVEEAHFSNLGVVALFRPVLKLGEEVFLLLHGVLVLVLLIQLRLDFAQKPVDALSAEFLRD